jgi:SpoVK/Ycf46/Vps4 family AAA+-type ATPase
VVLPTLSTVDLASITAQLVQEKGYSLRKYKHHTNGSNDKTTSVMRFIVSQRFSQESIRERNAHLARDMLDLAIIRKNERLEMEVVPKTEPKTEPAEVSEQCGPVPDLFSVQDQTVLVAADFDVKLLGAEERDSRRNAIDRDIDAMVGWEVGSSSNGDTLSPRAFLDMAKRTLLRLEKEQEDCECEQQSQQRFNWNVVVTGNPGAGKTTFARLLHRFLRAYGGLESDALVERNAVELKGQAVGETGPKTQQLFDEAKGGLLFIDEAYSLVGDDYSSDSRGGSDSYTTEAVRTMLTELENHRGTTCVVMAGYRDKMGRLLRADPGLPSRFPFRVHIPDYSPAEIALIAQQIASRQGYIVNGELLPKLEAHLEHVHGGGSDGEANGRLALNVVEAAIQQRAVRLDQQAANEDSQVASGGDQPAECAEGQQGDLGSTSLLPIDFNIGQKLGDEILKEQIDKEVSELIGMTEAKKWFTTLKNKVKLVDKTGDRTSLRTCLNMVITGNPGTGKTTFTRLLFRFLRAYGILPKDVFSEKNGLELKGQYVGDTSPKVIDAVAEAKGGCLFLDEAYALADDDGSGVGNGGDSFSREAIRTLLTEVENNR